MIAPACAGMRWAPAGLLTATAVSVLAVTDGAVGRNRAHRSDRQSVQTVAPQNRSPGV